MFSKIDLNSNYHELRMREEDIEKMTFKTGHVHYKYIIMSFGLTNAPSAFMKIMNRMLHVYFDDFIVMNRMLNMRIILVLFLRLSGKISFMLN
jgi:hypothetical protein